MKFYNPFKPHIVQFNDGAYGIRKFETLKDLIHSDPCFYDRDEDYWWCSLYPIQYKFKSLYEIKTQLSLLKPNNNNNRIDIGVVI